MNAAIENTQNPRKKKSFLRSLLGVAVLALILAALYWYTENFPALFSAAKPSDARMAVLEVKLDGLENSVALYDERIKKLETAAAEHVATPPAAAPFSPAASPVVASPAAEVPPATTPPVTMPAATPSANDDGKRIEALEKEIATLKAGAPMQDSEHISHSIKLLSSFHRLSDRVFAGKPYADELTALEDGLSDNSAQNKSFSELSAYAESGIPTQAELITSFDNAVDQVNTTLAVPPENAGAWDRFMFNMMHLVRVRRIDGVQSGKDTVSVIGRASAHLDKNEIEAAYAEINSLPENARADFTGWLEDAQIAIDAPGLLDQLEEQVMQQVFSAPAPIQDKAPADKNNTSVQ